MHDLRYAIRTLRKQPIFTLVAILTLALGIGANTAIFSLLYQILLRPLPYPDADRLVFVWNTYPGSNLPQASVSIPDYIDRKTQAPALEDATLFTGRSVNLNEGGRPEQLRALAVTPSFFSTLQRAPLLGRAFSEDEAKPDADRFAILTYGLWTSRYASDPSVVGRDIRVNGVAYRVLGVLPIDFELPARDVALLVPFSFTPRQMSDNARGNEFSSMIARLRRGATIEEANAQFRAIVARNLERLPERRSFAKTSGFSGYAIGMRDQIVGDIRTPLYLLQAGVVLVLLIACANVANLLLMRATSRQRELAIRTSLGAATGRIVRQLLTEGIVLSLAGAAAGIVLGIAGVKALIALSTTQIPGSPEATLYLPVLLFALALAIVTGLVFGLVPALTVLRANPAAFLKDDSMRGTAGKRTGATRAALVIAETAVAVVLLIGAGLLIKSFARLQSVNPGFSADNVLTAEIALPATRYPDAPARVAFWNGVLDRARAIPGVSSAGLTTNVPFNGMVSSGSYTIVGRTLAPGEPVPHGRQEIVGGDYFKAMQIPLVEGRTFADTDTASAPIVCVIDEYLVKKYFSDRSPLGQQIENGPTLKMTIVGVVATINSIDLGQPVTKERIYYAAAQQAPRGMALVVKTALDPLTIVPQVRAAVQAIDPEQPIAEVRTMDQWLSRSLQNRRTPMALLAVFGAIALLLSAIGIYGVIAFGVTERLREFGIRHALGADRGSIVSLVLSQGLRTAGLGIAAGLLGSLALTRYLQSLLFGVTMHDPIVFGSVAVALLAVALAACYVPAMRATRVDPIVALREG
jgi:putative ABC transport system permease protein